MLANLLVSIGYDIGPKGPWVIVLLTFVLGAAAAWRTGEVVAEGWNPSWPVALYAALLSGAVQFLHYALFQGPLLSLPNTLLDWAFLTFTGLAANRRRRARMMSESYPFVFERMGPFGWRRKTAS